MVKIYGKNIKRPKTRFSATAVKPVSTGRGGGMQDMEILSPEFTWSPHSLCKNMNMKEAELEKVKNMSDVPSQKQCGSCWAIATVGAIADNLLVAGVLPNNKRPVLSATYALMGGNNKCKIVYTDGSSKDAPCNSNNTNATWSQGKCGGGDSSYLLTLADSYGLPETICSDYSWCDKNDVCNPTKYISSSPSTKDMNELIPKADDGPSCYNSTEQPFFRIRFEGVGADSDSDRTTGSASVNASPSAESYFRLVCSHIRSNGPTIGSFLPFKNFDNGANAYQTYMDGDVKKETPWKGIYLEQIDYPGGDNFTPVKIEGPWNGSVPKGKCWVVENIAYGSAWGNCLVSKNLNQLNDHYSNKSADSDTRYVLSDMDTALMSKKVFSGCKSRDGSVNYDTVYYISLEGQSYSESSGGLVEPRFSKNNNGYYPYELSPDDGHAAVIMGWGADYIDWPICQSSDSTRSIEGCSNVQEYCKKLVKFWYVRNSWDVDWGDAGYCKIAWYITPEERRNGKVGNVYTQFDYGYIYTTLDDINSKGDAAECTSFGPPSGGGMLLFSGYDSNGSPIQPTWNPCGSDQCSVDNIQYRINDPSGLNQSPDWYRNQEKGDVRVPSYSPLSNPPEMCEYMAKSSGKLPPYGGEPGGGNGGEPGGGNGGESGGGTSGKSDRGRRNDVKLKPESGLSKKKKHIIIIFCVVAAIVAILLCVVVAN